MSGDAVSRLFIALWPDPKVRQVLRSWRDAWQWPRGATPVKPERLHMTLHFLGSVSNECIPELRDALALPFEPFELEFGVARLWPHGIAVLEPHAAPRQLVQLHADLGAALTRLGMTVDERSFKPHVTMARRAVKATVPGEGPPLTWSVDGYSLMESSAVGYTALQSYP